MSERVENISLVNGLTDFIPASENQQFEQIENVESFLHDIFAEKAPLIKTYRTISTILFQKLESDKAKEIITNTDKNTYKYIDEIANIENGNFIIRALDETKDLIYSRIVELFECVHRLKIEDKEGILILAKASRRLRGQDCLLIAANIQDNYLREIIYNRPHFSLQAKLDSILNAAKNSEGTHIIKYGNLFLNTEKNGNITSEANNGSGESRALGLFTGDMQFVDQLSINVYDSNRNELSGQLINSENSCYKSYDENFYNETVFIKRNRIINGALFENIELFNSGAEHADITITISSIIKDIFEIRGKISVVHKPGEILTDCNGDILINSTLESNNTYGIRLRSKEENDLFYPKYFDEKSNKVIYEIRLLPNTVRKISISIQPLLNNLPYVDGEIITEPPETFEEASSLIENSKKSEFAKIKIEADIPNIQKTIDKCIGDLSMLVSYINIENKSYSYIDAGLPRYATLFGRDSIITALEVFPLNQDIAKDTLELLAKFQGKFFEDRYEKELDSIKNMDCPESSRNAMRKGLKNLYLQREESHGKILHELRVGELAITGQIPHRPYYGTVDATPLWLILLGEYYKWSKDIEFVQKLLPNAEAALDWINANMLRGYLRFSGSFHSTVKIKNQGWKDAGDSIRHVINPKGILTDPEYPIALAEVQAYVFKAFILMSEIYNALGKYEKKEKLIKQAIDLKLRFNKDFWVNEERFFTMALDKWNIPIRNITSNIGHCLTMGIIGRERLQTVQEKIMSEEMYTGWGIRTLGSKCHAYDPISYHNGSVWVHDSAFVATGLSKKHMAQITKSLFEAANMFEDNRLPELFGGFARKVNDKFIQDYPEACSPQAWASGSLIWLLLKLLGLKNKNGEIISSKAYIPEWLKEISVENIKFNSERINITQSYK